MSRFRLKDRIKRSLLQLAITAIVLFGASVYATAQCGLPGTPPCGNVRNPPRRPPASPPPRVHLPSRPKSAGSQSSQVQQSSGAVARSNGRSAAPRFNAAGIVQVERGELEAAIALFTKAIEADSDFVVAYWYRGDARKQRNDYDGAIEDFKKVVEIDPTYGNAYASLGYAYTTIGELDAAAAAYSKALDV